MKNSFNGTGLAVSAPLCRTSSLHVQSEVKFTPEPPEMLIEAWFFEEKEMVDAAGFEPATPTV